MSNPKELGSADDNGHPGDGSLERFLTYYPCLRFFCAVAHRQFPSSHRPETRVARLREEHPKFYGLCIGVDFLIVVLVALALVGVAGIVAYKAVLAPIG